MIKFTRSDIEEIKGDLYRETGILYLLNAESEDIRDILIELETLFKHITSWERIERFDNKDYFKFNEDYFEFIVLLQKRVYYEQNLDKCIAHKTLVDKIREEATGEDELKEAYEEYMGKCREIKEKYELEKEAKAMERLSTMYKNAVRQQSMNIWR